MKQICLKTVFFTLFCVFSIYSFSQDNLESILNSKSETVTDFNTNHVYVSNIKAETRGNSIYLSWSVKSGLQEKCYIYRSIKPISNLQDAKLITEIPEKTFFYYDKPSEGSYYYAILTSSEKENSSPKFIPIENATTQAVSPGIITDKEPAKIANLQAIANKKSVTVSYISSATGRKLVLYRSIVPFVDSSTLLNAVIAGVFLDNGESFVDYPMPGIPCYYSLIDEEDIRSGNIKFEAGINTTTKSVQVQEENSKITTSKEPRTLPLPVLSNKKGLYPERQEISQEAESIVAQKIKNTSKDTIPSPKPFYFPEELQKKSTGEEYALKTIIDSTFVKKEWNNAETQLKDFLALHRADQTIARTNHYLGQVYFFNKDYDKALIRFLLARNIYYQKSQEWIQYSLAALENKRK